MNSFVETLRNLGPARLAMMAGVAAAIFGFFIYMMSRVAAPEMGLLYAELDPEDSGAIVSRLEQMEVPVRVGASGGQIYVPNDQVARLRLAMAEEGLPRGGSIGYEIFDRSEGLGTTNFVQNINHVRALEGELARTIRTVRGVKQARVHLVLPRRELFSRDRQEPSASIVLTIVGSRILDRQQVLAIQHLVAAAVPGLKPTKVSVVDDKGSLLARGGDGDELEAIVSSTEQMRRSFEQRLADTIQELLERSVGRGNARVEVSATMDFDRVTENAEIYDPDGQVVRSTQTVEEAANSQDSDGAPNVSVDNNLPGAELAGIGEEGSNSSSQTTRTEETVNYEISKVVKTHVRESGMLRRLSVAVLVDGSYAENAEGELVYQPRGEAELAQLATLVRTAAGIQEDRGDTLEIVNLQFVDPMSEPADEGIMQLVGLTKGDLMRVAELLVLGLVGALVLILVVRPLLGRLLESSASSGNAIATGAVDAQGNPVPLLADGSVPPGAFPALAPPDLNKSGDRVDNLPTVGDDGDDSDRTIDIDKVEGRVRSSIIKQIGEIVENHPDEAVAIVRSWLYQET